ncbi:LamG domain-containing protein [Myceligenerans pegani]|uniref:LamG domain-containing protein n=1 Tax=Myceligenerans pegani TaxID=2776917 RepID=A0ABR9MTI7_9MICO|nr:LamG domain-containing protein [Myceligenerans sp. TRM 65318]MBE1874376.1 LamG domain-containing protein [Myceligenerans sp. TRM 65318]MBE3016647.1 LamG domain-containing protein [Myceligenerans sp. TRM 65318]
MPDPEDPAGLSAAAGVYDIDIRAAQPGEPFAVLSDAAGVAGDVGWDNVPGQEPAVPAGERSLSVSLPGLPFVIGEPVVDGQDATRATMPLIDPASSQEVPGVRVVVTVDGDGTGLLPVLQIDDAEAYQRLDDASGGAGVSFEMAASDDLRIESPDPVDTGDGQIVPVAEFDVVDPAAGDSEAGVKIFSGGRAQQWDSSAGQPEPVTEGSAAASALTVEADDVETEGEEPTGNVDRLVAPVDGDLVADMDVEIAADGSTVTATAAPEMFSDPDATGPFHVDPSIKGGLHEWTAVRSGWPTSSSSYKYKGSEGVGLCPTTGYPVCDRHSISRLLFEFDMSGLPDGVSGGHVSSASFSAVGKHSYTCTKYSVSLYRTGANVVSSSTNWNSKGSWASDKKLSERKVTHRAGCAGQSYRVSWGAKAAAQVVANNNWNYLTLGLRANDEGNQVKWQRYVASQLDDGTSRKATFTVTFNRPPIMPSTASMRTKVSSTGDELDCATWSGDPTVMRTRRPYFQARGTDPDGGSPWNQKVQVKFRVIPQGSHTPRWESGWTSLKASGSTHRVQVPSGKALASNTVYKWHARTRDSSGKTSAWSDTTCWIRPDVTGPNPPDVSSSQYPGWPEGVHGAVGTSGTFTFKANGSNDLAAYKYSFNDGEKAGTIPTSGSTAKSVSFAPSRPGYNEVVVQSKDEAGIWSDETKYEFWVAYPARDGLWHMDEGTGTTAVNEVTTAPTAGDLTWSSGVTWGTGAWRETLADPNDPGDPRYVGDRSLVFDGTGFARSEGPAVAIDQSYTIMAFLKPADDFSGVGAAVSQEGENRSAFHLGYTNNANCNTDVDEETGLQVPCWGLWVKDADEVSAGHQAARSDVPAVAGQWVHVVGMYDASDPANPTLSVRVCDPTDAPATPEPVMVQVDPVMWTAPGPMRLGSGIRGGTPEWVFRGAVDDVRVYRELVDNERLNRICTGAETA